MRLDPRSLSVCVVTTSGGVRGLGHLDIAVAAIAGGATAIQLRAPELADDELVPLAREIGERCRAGGVPYVVNDRVDVAADVGAGAHVGQEDDPGAARDVLGPDAILGISVGSVEQVANAERAGADYLGVTVWSTPTKPNAHPIGLEGLRQIAAATSLPVVAIGGIDETNAREVIDAGAAGVAVISAVANADDPVAATRRLVAVVRRASAMR